MGPDHASRFALNKPDTPVVIGYRSRFQESDALRSAFGRLELTRPDETREADAARCVSCDRRDLRDWNLTARTPSKSKTRASVTPAAAGSRSMFHCPSAFPARRKRPATPYLFHRDAHERNRIASSGQAIAD